MNPQLGHDEPGDDEPGDDERGAPRGALHVAGYHIAARIGFDDDGTELYAAVAAGGAPREIAVLPRPATPDDLVRLTARAAAVVAASRVRHPALATIEDAGITSDGRLFVATTRPADETLEDALRARGATGARAALRIALRAAEALSAAHAAGVVHGELTPARIRVGTPAAGDAGPAVTVTGLGLRQARPASAPPHKAARPYAAPEQWVGGEADPTIDVFALASITLAALSGRAPAAVRPPAPGEARTPAATLRAEAEPHPSVLHVLSRARAADPARRYPTMAAFADALERAAAPIWAATPPSLKAVAPPAPAPVPAAAPPVQLTAIGRELVAELEAEATAAEPAAAPRRAEPGEGAGARPAAVHAPASADSARGRRLVARGAALLAAGIAAWALWPGGAAPARAPGSAAPPAATARPSGAAPVAPPTSAAAAPVPRDSTGRMAGAAAVPPAGRRAAADPAPPARVAVAAPGRAPRAGRRAVRAGAARTARRPAVARAAVGRPDVPAPRRELSAAAGEPPTPAAVAAPAAAPARAAAAPPPRPAPPSVDAMRAGVDAVLAEYARAIEARDLVALRRAYPGMTADQQRGWRTFFASVRDVRTRLAVAGVRGVGDHVVADVRGSYEFQNRSPNRAERAPVRFRATVTRSAEGWRLRAVE